MTRVAISEYEDEWWYEAATKNVPPENKRARLCISSGRSGFLERKAPKSHSSSNRKSKLRR